VIYKTLTCIESHWPTIRGCSYAKQSLNVKFVIAQDAKQVYRFKNITERLYKTKPRDCFTQLHYLMVDQ
jgi:hypothetical protein